ncbi:high mobility group protein HMG-I/HMG-Y isoform X2 [Rhinoderma darwinii]
MSDSKAKAATKGASTEDTEKRGRGRPRKKPQETSSKATKSSSPPQVHSDSKEREPSGSPTTKRPRGRPKGTTKKTNANTKNPQSGKGSVKTTKKQADEEGTAESSEDQ